MYIYIYIYIYTNLKFTLLFTYECKPVNEFGCGKVIQSFLGQNKGNLTLHHII